MWVSVAEGARYAGMRRERFERFIAAGYIHVTRVPYSLIGEAGSGPRKVDTEEVDSFMRSFAEGGQTVARLAQGRVPGGTRTTGSIA